MGRVGSKTRYVLAGVVVAGVMSACEAGGRPGAGGTFGTLPPAAPADHQLVEDFHELVTSDDFSFRAEQTGVVPGAGPEELTASFVVEGDDAAGTLLVGGGATTVEGVVVGDNGYIQHLGGNWQRVPRIALDTLGVTFDLFAFIDSEDDLAYAGPSDELGEPLHLLVNSRPLELEQGPTAEQDVNLGEVTDLEIFVRGDGTPVLMRYVVRGSDIAGETAAEETLIQFSDVGADFDISPPEGVAE